jgi:hypothetical protein
MFFILNITSKQELSEPHHLMALAPTDDFLDAAPYGSTSCFVNTDFSLFSF